MSFGTDVQQYAGRPRAVCDYPPARLTSRLRVPARATDAWARAFASADLSTISTSGPSA